MLKYAVKHNGADWNQIKVTDAGTPDKMEAAFLAGAADYVHLQGPVVAGEILASVGASMPPVAFSSLCCTRAYQKTEGYSTFLRRMSGRGNGFEPDLPRRSQPRRPLSSLA
jgi:hypothetical protein